jgi:hypothetical protein
MQLNAVYINQKHSKEYSFRDECKFDRAHFADKTSSTSHICPLACFPSESIWTYGSYRPLVGLLGWVINPVTRPLSRQDNTHTHRRNAETSMPRVEFEPTILVSEWVKTFHALDCMAAVIDADIIDMLK